MDRSFNVAHVHNMQFLRNYFWQCDVIRCHLAEVSVYFFFASWSIDCLLILAVHTLAS